MTHPNESEKVYPPDDSEPVDSDDGDSAPPFPAFEPSETERKREYLGSLLSALMPSVLRVIYPDEPEPEPEPVEELVVTTAAASFAGTAVPRPAGDGWELVSSVLDAGAVTVLWRRVRVIEPGA